MTEGGVGICPEVGGDVGGRRAGQGRAEVSALPPALHLPALPLPAVGGKNALGRLGVRRRAEAEEGGWMDEAPNSP